ncbi:hypothetical protein [Hyphobacterium sp.]|uniref:hypothetical protein n=1 Tax=Hyphobacterium sp. TaxID=2004662 RepID=UPI003BACC125
MIAFALAAALMAQDVAPSETPEAGGLPACDRLESNDRHEDCALQPVDGRELVVTFTFADGEWGQNGRMEVNTGEGRLLQVFEFETESFLYPSLEDINVDGREEILVPLITGNVNTDYAVFMGLDDGFLTDPFRTHGHTIEPAPHGMFVVHSRESAAAYWAEFFAFEDGTVNAIASVSISYEHSGEGEGPTCRLVEGGDDLGEDFYCGAVLTE